MSETPDGYGLVMPFVVVHSTGGPYDDEAFVVGYEMGQLDATLAVATEGFQQWIHTTAARQADLLAMRYGFTAHWGEEFAEWLAVTFHKEAGEQ